MTNATHITRRRLRASVSLPGTVLGIFFVGVPLLLPESLVGYADSALASCLMEESVYKCSGRNARATSLILEGTVAFPNLKVMLESNYIRSNPTVSASNGLGLHVKSDPGFGPIELIQAAGGSLTGGYRGLLIANRAGETTAINLSGDVSSTTGAAVEVVADQGDLRFEQQRGMISGNRSGALLSLASGSANVVVAGDVRAVRDQGLLLTSGAGANEMSVELAPESKISSAMNGPAVRLHHDGLGQQKVEANGSITADGSNARGLEITNTTSAETVIVKQASSGHVKASSTGIRLLNSGTGGSMLEILGTVQSTHHVGVFAEQGERSADLSISASGKINSALAGIVARQRGSGATHVAIDGDISSAAAAGVQVESEGGGGISINQTGGTISGRSDGVRVVHGGAGNAAMTITQDAAGSITGASRGLSVSNRTAGATSVDVSGHIASGSGTGVEVIGSDGGLSFEQRQGVITGMRSGASLSGHKGNTLVRIAGEISATEDYGLFANSGAYSGKMLVELAPNSAITSLGNKTAVRLYHSGEGEQSVQLAGKITAAGSNARGVEVFSAASADDLLLNQSSTAAVKATSTGVYSLNSGTGASKLEADGSVESETHFGIYLENAERATDLSATVSGKVSSKLAGVVARQQGTGATRLRIGGDIASTHSVGVQIEHDGQGDVSLTQSGGNIVGHIQGISLANRGAGDATIDLAGDVRGSVGITNYGEGDISITQHAGSVTQTEAAGSIAIDESGNSVDVKGGNGIVAVNHSFGSTRIVVAGNVSAPVNAVGADSKKSESTISIVQSSGKIESAGTAINLGLSGNNVLEVNGIVRGGSGSAIFILSPIKASIDIRNDADVSAASGIAIWNGGTLHGASGTLLGGDIVVRSSGTIFGDTLLQNGHDRFELLAGSYTGDIYGDYRDALGVEAGDPGDGDDTFIWSGGSFVGGYYGGGGSDIATITAAKYDGTQVLDGGDDTSISDGMVDLLTFGGVSAKSEGRKINNWEVVWLDGTHLEITDGEWVVGAVGEPATGVSLANHSILSGRSDLLLATNLSIDNTSSLMKIDDRGGTITIGGDVHNAGVITMQNGEPRDSIAILGDFAGHGGTVVLDTALGDDLSPTDRLIVSGDTNGHSWVKIANIGGVGYYTKEGIKIIDIGGQSNGSFALNGDYTTHDGQQAILTSSAFAYTLQKGSGSGTQDGNWYLVSQNVKRTDLANPVEPANPTGPRYSVAAPVYESYSATLQSLNRLPTLHERVGDRLSADQAWGSTAASAGETTPTGIWGRIEGAHNRIQAGSSAGDLNQNINTFILQAGVDGQFYEGDTGRLLAGITGQYGKAHGNIDNLTGDGSGTIDTQAWGLGANATFYGNSGFYLDARAQANWYDSDLGVDAINRMLANSNKGFGYALSLEAGQRFTLNENWSLTPQAQLMWSSVDFDSFTDSYGARISNHDGDSLTGRLGLAANYANSFTGSHGRLVNTSLYGIANLYQEFLGNARMNYAGTHLDTDTDKTWGGIGMGGSYSWADNKYALYGEGSINTALSHFANSYTLKGNIGLNMTW